MGREMAMAVVGGSRDRGGWRTAEEVVSDVGSWRGEDGKVESALN